MHAALTGVLLTIPPSLSLLSGCLSSDSTDPLHDLHQCSTGGSGWQQEWSCLVVYFTATTENILPALQRSEPRPSSCDRTPGKETRDLDTGLITPLCGTNSYAQNVIFELVT